ncbi:YsnF/AvaK domain-containing protein [Deinococcus arenicola]|uniref:YsnF/AvaK domain-containing protein n=1 Tax=Deinococcus arenicola TaxID=2994950 RepID=A0ABU4DV42_9DEIO|nr:YsnF/AvaK domain-containing protein [Deinococcus sp. ZS9-10]MDV6376315.1 YsnF/AvaK domain-containing protein [Deinococcus sp. ZS9-10]
MNDEFPVLSGEFTIVGQLRLLGERADVRVVREQAGVVTIRKVLTEREVTLPVTLTTETLKISVREGAGRVFLGEQALLPGQTYTVTLTEERAEVVKTVVPLYDVTLTKRGQTHMHEETLTLRREVLDVQGDPALIHDIDVSE